MLSDYPFAAHYLRAGSSVSTPIPPATNAACNSYLNVTYIVSHWPSSTAEDGDTTDHFVQDLALAAKPCPHRPQAFIKVNNGQVLPYDKNLFVLFPNEPIVKPVAHVSEDLAA